jgi:isopentenyldiphosphate isomerase
MIDSQDSFVPQIDENGCVIGKMTRGEAHSGSRLLHPVVHLHVFNSKGEVYLQKRPDWKDIQPGKWDTSVGGHVDYGEDIPTALRRVVREELGITDYVPKEVTHYVYDSRKEREMVYVYSTVYDKPIHPDAVELSDGRFWSMQEVKMNIGQGIFTPNFEEEFQKYFL